MPDDRIEDIKKLKAIVDAPPAPLPFHRALAYGLLDALLRSVSSRSDPREIELHHIRRVLIYSATGLGNTLLFIPAYRLLRHHLPEAEIWVVGPEDTMQVYQSVNFDIQRFLAVEDFSGFLGKAELVRMIRAERFDLSIRLFSVRGFWTSIITALSRVPVRIGHRYTDEPHQRDLSYVNSHIVRFQPGRHEVELNLDLVRVLDPDADFQATYTFELRSEEERFAAELLRKHGLDQFDLPIGFHLGCSPAAPFKLWSPDRFVDLANRLVKKHGIKPILFWGPAEREATQEAARRIPESFLVPQPLPFTHTAAVMKACRGVISNDSALMHLAAALDIPAVGIFGPTDPARIGPFGPRHGIARLGLVCSPCYEKRVPESCRQNPPPYCLTYLTVEQVIPVIEQTFSFLNKGS